MTSGAHSGGIRLDAKIPGITSTAGGKPTVMPARLWVPPKGRSATMSPLHSKAKLAVGPHDCPSRIRHQTRSARLANQERMRTEVGPCEFCEWLSLETVDCQTGSAIAVVPLLGTGLKPFYDASLVTYINRPDRSSNGTAERPATLPLVHGAVGQAYLALSIPNACVRERGRRAPHTVSATKAAARQ